MVVPGSGKAIGVTTVPTPFSNSHAKSFKQSQTYAGSYHSLVGSVHPELL